VLWTVRLRLLPQYRRRPCLPCRRGGEIGEKASGKSKAQSGSTARLVAQRVWKQRRERQQSRTLGSQGVHFPCLLQSLFLFFLCALIFGERWASSFIIG
jgi:hypothetical protein